EKAGREIALPIIDELWADYLANVSELRGGIHWISWGGGDSLCKFLAAVQQIYAGFQDCLKQEIAVAFATAVIRNGDFHFQQTERLGRGATWTYIATDQPFGTFSERILKGLLRRVPKKRGRN